ncbi:carbohydrate esterase family 4 protein [Mycena olivaceomarginata]|nr:carbohydrate esterase family 4 protein [Mycena olivaceomarginata]
MLAAPLSAVLHLFLLLATGAHAQDRTTEQGEAAVTNPSAECTPYSYPPPASSRPSGQTPASYSPTIPRGRAKFLVINGSVPAISPKGTLSGDFSNFTPSYPPSDPDCWWTYHQCVNPKLNGLSADVASVPEPRTLGYGFDDGPNCSHNAFYDYLRDRKQLATMFYIGSNVLDWPLEAQRAVADGHEICVHTWSHNYMTAFSNEGVFAELWYSMKAIKLVTGVTPRCWRPPFGDVDDRVRYIAAQLGLETVLWKYDSFDWKVGTAGVTQDTVAENYKALIDDVKAGVFDTIGAIMLTHELNAFTMQAAIDNYPQLAKAFDHIVPIAVAQNRSQPYAESNYTMPSFEQYTANHSAATSLNGLNDTSNGVGSGKAAQASSFNGASSGAVRRRLLESRSALGSVVGWMVASWLM